MIAQGIDGARSIMFDSEGHLLVVSRGKGVYNLELNDGGGTCISVVKSTVLIKSAIVSSPKPVNRLLRLHHHRDYQ